VNDLTVSVSPGEHVVAEVVQPGWVQTHAPSPVTVVSGEDTLGVDFGNKALPGSIHGQKWNDLNNNAVKDPGEPGLQGWTIFIDQNSNRVLDPGESYT